MREVHTSRRRRAEWGTDKLLPLMLKVVHETGFWYGSISLSDQDGCPIKSINLIRLENGGK